MFRSIVSCFVELQLISEVELEKLPKIALREQTFPHLPLVVLRPSDPLQCNAGELEFSVVLKALKTCHLRSECLDPRTS